MINDMFGSCVLSLNITFDIENLADGPPQLTQLTFDYPRNDFFIFQMVRAQECQIFHSSAKSNET
jgi:hypothetical protein